MLEFEPRAFGVGIDRNANWATTTVLVYKREERPPLKKLNNIGLKVLLDEETI